ncbi:2OG-Fe(II) oxygenase family protein [Phenylobacterium immobile]|uniref:2OG-Fe(II) oxygenase family protein n=1 Tax=Phenylobacterium immobile TaxID=21 RepID=UPI000B1745F9|nr:2OG-Fe(II) oxygenase [Phenylobacterium immobile]
MSARLYAPAPWFSGRSHTNPKFAFSSLGGRFIQLVFLPSDPAQREAIINKVESCAAQFGDDNRLVCFLVVRDEARFNRGSTVPGLRWFWDHDGAIGRLYGALGEDNSEAPASILIDPSLRILAIDTITHIDQTLARLERLPPVEQHARAVLHAPVLIVPRIFEPELCRRLIGIYDADGGKESGVMREIDGRTVAVLSDFKQRSDVTLEDEALRVQLRNRLAQRLLPEIKKAFLHEATRIERYIVACYDSDSGGYFRPHRDNTTPATAHRQFAVSINLNAEEYEGGDLRFPEFGRRTYRPPTGGAVVFSCTLLHEATPVTRGRRYAFLPFLFNEAGEETRQKNLHLLDLDVVQDLRVAGRSN